MNKTILKLFLVSIAILMLSSCTRRVLDFTLISSKNVDLSQAANFEKGSQRIEGEDLAHWIIIIPTHAVSIKEALDLAIESTPGCVALLDGVIYSKFWWIPYIYGKQSVLVQGTPLIDRSLVNASEESLRYGKIELNRNGEIECVEGLSIAEYNDFKNKIVKEADPIRFSKSNTLK